MGGRASETPQHARYEYCFEMFPRAARQTPFIWFWHGGSLCFKAILSLSLGSIHRSGSVRSPLRLRFDVLSSALACLPSRDEVFFAVPGGVFTSHPLCLSYRLCSVFVCLNFCHPQMQTSEARKRKIQKKQKKTGPRETAGEITTSHALMKKYLRGSTSSRGREATNSARICFFFSVVLYGTFTYNNQHRFNLEEQKIYICPVVINMREMRI